MITTILSQSYNTRSLGRDACIVQVIRGQLDRVNLKYTVRYIEQLDKHHGGAYFNMLDLLHAHAAGGSLVYCLSRDDCDQLAERLKTDGLDAASYNVF